MEREVDNIYLIDVGYACFGIETNYLNRVIKAAPIAKWMEGRSLQEIEDWVGKKNGKIKKLN